MPQAQQGVSSIVNLFPLFAIFVIFYFLLIRPQKARDKEHKKMLDNLKKNDEIVTTSGIHGTIVNVKEKSLILRIDENVKVELEKNCVAYIKKPQGSSQEG